MHEATANTGIANSGANPAERVEAILRDDLANGDAMLGSIAPILRHLLANDDHSVFGDEVIARVRGMAAHITAQLVCAVMECEPGDLDAAGKALAAELGPAIVGHQELLCHLHALAMEWHLTERLQGRIALDPVLPPLLQALIASGDAVTSGMAMKLLAAQSRFGQAQRRMQLPIGELPGDLLHLCLQALRAVAGHADPGLQQRVIAAESAIRSQHDEAHGRLGIMARLVTGMGAGAVAALSISHAGPAMFLTALALASGQERDLAVLATNESQMARLALALRAAGLKPEAIEQQFVALHPDIALPDDFEALGADRAAALLAVSSGYRGM